MSLFFAAARTWIYTFRPLLHLLNLLHNCVHQFQSFPAGRTPFPFYGRWADKYGKRELCHVSKLIVLSMRDGLLAAWGLSLGPVARSPVSATRWLKGIKTYRFPWYLTLVGVSHALSNPGHWPVSRKSRKLFGPGKPFVKLPTACFGKPIF